VGPILVLLLSEETSGSHMWFITYEPRKFICYFKHCLKETKIPRFHVRLIHKFQLNTTKKLQLYQFAVAAGGPRLFKILAMVLGRINAISARNGSTKIVELFPLKQSKWIFRGLVGFIIIMTENIGASAFTNTQHLTIFQ
jgi:hypothetical protein